MSGSRYVSPYTELVDGNGVPLPGAQLFFYQTGTSTPQNTYSDSLLSVPNANPVVANAAGLFPSIFLLATPSYKVVATDQYGNQQWTADPVGPNAGAINVPSYLVGIALWFAGVAGEVPAGSVQLYGQAVSRTTYPLTFAALGTTWGIGDGSTTFNLPDMRGRVPAGVDNMGGTAASRLTTSSLGSAAVVGVTGGNELLQSHTHVATDLGHLHTIPSQTELLPGGSGNMIGILGSSAAYATNEGYANISVTASGGGSSQNVQPTAIGFYIMFLA
jgi:microcystin-dependent protein